MNKVLWSSYSDSDADSFKIYRAITGIAVDFPNTLTTGDQFIFAATSPSIQRVTIAATDIDSVATAINSQAQGVKATKSQSGTTLFIRCTARNNAKLKLMPCAFLAHTGQALRIVVPGLEFQLLTTVSADPAPADYEYDDADGDPLDQYRITSVKSSVESVPSIIQMPLITPESLCVVEGRVLDVQNNPISGALVQASPIGGVEVSDNSGLVSPGLQVTTDELGRWSMPVLQGTQLLFQIAAIGYNQVVQIPAQPYMLFKDLAPVNDYYFSPDGEIFGGIDNGDEGAIF